MTNKTKTNDTQKKKTIKAEHVLVVDSGEGLSQAAKDIKIPCGPFVIIITVTRGGGTYSTLGEFTMHVLPPSCYSDDVSDLKDVSGVTLELRHGKYDINIGEGEKDYPIPIGKYSARKSERFNNIMFELVEVPGFAGIQIHLGNGPWNTHACILVGSNAEPGKIVFKEELRDHSSDWKHYVELKFIDEIMPELNGNSKPKDGKTKERGTSDWINGSGAKLKEMAKLYKATKEKADSIDATVKIKVTVQ